MFSIKYWTFFSIVLVAIGYSMLNHDKPADRDLITSPADNYRYKTLRLDNQLPIILVEAPDQKKAAAAMTVKVGSGDDPADRAGLAHFLEHMLFLGTEPYPEAGEYQNFISQNGGSHNAFTASDRTTYFFEIDNDEFKGALNRFAPFFISPTFDEQFVEREINAVHAEYSSKLKDDFRRIYSAEKQVMNPAHPHANFSTGNLATLSDRPGQPIRDDLLAFYAQHYSAPNMALVMVANYPLEQMEQWAVEQFAAISSKPISYQTHNQPIFLEEQLPLDLYIEPIKEIRRLQLTFPMPASDQLYQYKPLSILSNLLGHEGQGSLLALFKSQGWAEGLSSGRSYSSPENSMLTIQIQLTALGLQHIDEMTDAVFQYVEQLNDQPLPEYLTREQQQLSDLAFRFQQQGKLSDFAVRLSTNLTYYPMHDAIYGNYRYEQPPKDLLNPFLKALTPDNMLRTVVAPANDIEQPLEQRDPFYNTAMQAAPSSYRPITQTQGATLQLPKPNPFVPTDFSLNADQEIATPELLINTPERQVWYYPDSEFELPRGQLLVRLQSEPMRTSAKSRVTAQLYARAVNEMLNADSYPAQLAGLSYGLSASSMGLDINLGGYHDKLPVLLDSVLTAMNSAAPSTEQLKRYQASLQRSYENSLKDKPFRRTLSTLKRWLFVPSFSEEQLIAEINQITVDDIKSFNKQLSQQLSTITYIHGQMGQAKAIAMAEQIDSVFSANSNIPELSGVLQAPVGRYQQMLALDHPDSAITLYYQGHDTSDRHRAEMALLAQILSAPYYQYMRTEKQLGYIVFATPLPQQTVPGLALIVQSPQASPQHLIDESERFFKDFQGKLKTIPESEFNQYRDGLITLLREQPKNMNEKASQFWREINMGRHKFDTNHAIADHVEKLQLADIERLYQLAIFDGDLPQILISQGGKVKGYDRLSRLKRQQLSTFPKPSLMTDQVSISASNTPTLN